MSQQGTAQALDNLVNNRLPTVLSQAVMDGAEFTLPPENRETQEKDDD